MFSQCNGGGKRASGVRARCWRVKRTRERREEPREPNVPDATLWKENAVTLRHSARRQRNSLERQTLLTLAEDCDAIAAELESQAQQPGKPKPPGNPHRPPSREV